MNEPTGNCQEGYGSGGKAPGKTISDIGPYLCIHNTLKAHAKVYRIYDNEFRKSQNGKISIVLPCDSYYPKYANDTETAEVLFEFRCGWLANPIFSEKGDCPDVMKRRIAEISKLEGYPRSRLPEFTQTEIDYIRGTADYMGLNHYTSVMTEPAPKSDWAVWYKDVGVVTSSNDSWPHTVSSWLRVVPQGFGDILRKIKNLYNNPPIYVLENGVGDDGSSLDDYQRIEYLHDYLRELLLAVNRDNVNVKGYFVWSLLDNFEWQRRYKEHWGLLSVDFQNPNEPRSPKLSYNWVKELIRTRELPPRNPVPRSTIH